MKLRVKTLKGSQFTVDVDDAATVRATYNTHTALPPTYYPNASSV